MFFFSHLLGWTVLLMDHLPKHQVAWHLTWSKDLDEGFKNSYNVHMPGISEIISKRLKQDRACAGDVT